MNDLDDNGLDANPSSTWILLQIGDSGEDFAVLSCALGISAGKAPSELATDQNSGQK